MILGLAGAMAFAIGRCDARPSKLDQSAPARPARVAVPVAHDAAPAPAPGALRLEGQVIDDRDEPVAGATVTLVDAAASATSAADGSFVFEHLAPARYCATATDGIARVAGRVCRKLSPDSDVVVLQLEKATTLTVRVVDRATRVPIAGATLARDNDDGAPTADVITDEQGTGALHMLLPGHEVALDVTHPHYEPQRVWHSLLLDPDQHGELVVALDRGAVLGGTVVDADGHPIPGADVSVMASWRSSTQTDERGRWSFTAMAAGPHKLQAWVGEQTAEPVVLDLDGARFRRILDSRISLASNRGIARDGSRLHSPEEAGMRMVLIRRNGGRRRSGALPPRASATPGAADGCSHARRPWRRDDLINSPLDRRRGYAVRAPRPALGCSLARVKEGPPEGALDLSPGSSSRPAGRRRRLRRRRTRPSRRCAPRRRNSAGT